MLRKLAPFSLLFLTFVIFPYPALADSTNNQLEIVQNNGSWSSPVPFNLNLNESFANYGITVNFKGIGTNKTIASYKISGGSITDVNLAENQAICILGTCTSPNHAGDVRLTLLKIQSAQTTAATPTAANPIIAYLLTNNIKTPLTKNPTDPPMNTYDASAGTPLNEVDVYFERQPGIEASISVAGKAGTSTLKTPQKIAVDSNRVKFALVDNGIYTFIVTSNGLKFLDTSGAVDLYILSVNGISSSSTGGITVSGTYKVTLPDTQLITMSERGTFEQLNGVIVSAQNPGNIYTFSFINPGNYRAKYAGISGANAYVDFSVILPTVTPIPPNQQSGGGSWFLGIIFVGLIGVTVLFWKRRKTTKSVMRKGQPKAQ